MRYGPFVGGLAVCIALSAGALVCERAAIDSLEEEARLAIDIRCGKRDDRATQACRRTLRRLYIAGSLEPDRTLRAYCDSVEVARWGGSRPAPPEICVQRYGGWPTD